MPAHQVIKQLARTHGGKVLDQAIDLALDKLMPLAEPIVKKPTGIGGRLVSAALLKVATKSVPGAIIVGGAFVAKRLHDRRKAQMREQSAHK